MTLIPRLAEALDTELIRQKIASRYVIDLDPESLAVAAWRSVADQIEAWGHITVARHIRYEIAKEAK